MPGADVSVVSADELVRQRPLTESVGFVPRFRTLDVIVLDNGQTRRSVELSPPRGASAAEPG